MTCMLHLTVVGVTCEKHPWPPTEDTKVLLLSSAQGGKSTDTSWIKGGVQQQASFEQPCTDLCDIQVWRTAHHVTARTQMNL